MSEPSASVAACLLTACAVDLVADLDREPDGVDEQVLDLPEIVGVAVDRGGEDRQRLGERPRLLALQRTGKPKRGIERHSIRCQCGSAVAR